MKLYVHRCGCIGSERFADGTVFVLQNCDGDLVFDRIELSEDPAARRPSRKRRRWSKWFSARSGDAKNSHAFRETLRSVVKEF